MSDPTERYPADGWELPDPGDPSPDASYYFGWVVQHNRLWLLCGALLLLMLASLTFNIVQLRGYKPTVKFVTLENGYPVVVNTEAEIMVDGQPYRPTHLRAVVQSFIMNRYQYNWQNLQRINRAMEYMRPAAVEAEREKIREADLGNRVFNTRTVYRLRPEIDNWEVVALGRGRFRVTVPGVAYINDNVNHTDPDNPFPLSFTIELVVATSPFTDVNPFGYQIVETGRDLI